MPEQYFGYLGKPEAEVGMFVMLLRHPSSKGTHTEFQHSPWNVCETVPFAQMSAFVRLFFQGDVAKMFTSENEEDFGSCAGTWGNIYEGSLVSVG